MKNPEQQKDALEATHDVPVETTLSDAELRAITGGASFSSGTLNA